MPASPHKRQERPARIALGRFTPASYSESAVREHACPWRRRSRSRLTAVPAAPRVRRRGRRIPCWGSRGCASLLALRVAWPHGSCGSSTAVLHRNLTHHGDGRAEDGSAFELGDDAGLAGVAHVPCGHHGDVSEDAAVRGRRSTHSRAPCIREPFAARAGPRVALWRR